MPRLTVVSPDQATGPVKQIYDDLTMTMGKVVKSLSGHGEHGGLRCGAGERVRQRSAARRYDLDHSRAYILNDRKTGMTYQPIENYGVIGNMRTAALIAVDGSILPMRSGPPCSNSSARFSATKGFVKDKDIEAVRQAGYSDGQIAESIGYIGLATFSNLFNHVHDTTVDFPPAQKLGGSQE